MLRDEAILLDIAYAARKVVAFTAKIEREDLVRDERTLAAVLYEITVMGEAVKRLSKEFRAAHPQIPWRDIAGMRDWLIHHYDRLDYDRVWGVVRTHIPELLTRLEPLLPRDKD